MHRLFFGNIPSKTLMFDRFELVRCLSAGQYSGVYLCKDQSAVDRRVVIKVLSKNDCHDQGLLNRFFEEIKITRQIRHPYVMQCTEWMNDNDFVAYSMDYIAGGTLADQITSGSHSSITNLMKILMQLCEGMQAIHAAGVIHRDLKPENVLVEVTGDIRICDFGIAANMFSPTVGEEDAIIGSMNYLSPEYVTHGVFDQRSDIYSLGVIAYELATKHLPFAGEDLMETLRLRVKFNPAPPIRFRPDMPHALNDLIMKALNKNPALRFDNCTEMLHALKRLGEMSPSIKFTKSGIFSRLNYLGLRGPLEIAFSEPQKD